MNKKTQITVLMAATPKWVVGNNQNPPWNLPWPSLKGDLPRFKAMTKGQVIIMGSKTCAILKKPLDERVNVVLSRNKDWQPPEGFIKYPSLSQAIMAYAGKTEKIFLISGTIAGEGIRTKVVDKMIITRTYDEYEGDVYFPEFDLSEWEENILEKFPDEGYRYDLIELTPKR